MITIYTSHNSNSSRKAKAWPRKYRLPFIEHFQDLLEVGNLGLDLLLEGTEFLVQGL